MKIEVLGAGCAKCQKTVEKIKDIMSKNGYNAELVKIEDINEIISRGVLSTPSVFVDGKQMLAGHIPDEKMIISWFKN